MDVAIHNRDMVLITSLNDPTNKGLDGVLVTGVNLSKPELGEEAIYLPATEKIGSLNIEA